MRAIWKGSITFGLVNVPISVYSATESHDLRLHQVHDADGGRIRYQRRCEICGEPVEWDHINKAFDDGDRTVVITDDELSELPTEKSREIEILQFVPSDQVDPIMMAKTYYLAPGSTSAKSYALLRRTLEETDRTAIVSFTLRQRTQLGALRVREDVMLLQTLLWDDEVREPDFAGVDKDVRISAKELEMSQALVENFSGDFDPSEYTDEYQAQLRTLVEAKLEQGEAVDTEETFGTDREEGEEAEVLDLMEALRRSVSAAKEKKTGASSGSGGSGSKASSSSSAKKSTTSSKDEAKKPAAKKKTGTTARKKTASKKTA
ncbi:DNA end-binding protein Ku [Georgenia satyanarayanai]|uniref:Non-homologous end joining protein Ku n=1 Tax=Georgenia satyanarayanai TaxID=860221 RepID=A0A2Y8ZVI5_9MICO|nr:Ku protein [Georgenia satyanarayanai]PYG01580.1 DNA end-binding protein Ku [Georgenia satyanarayanai]SSA36380.1 DNA end-binding protein Ku [Georgenia satyanarayanai]